MGTPTESNEAATMSTTLTNEEIARLGVERYERDIRSSVEPKYSGRFLVLDVLTGDYEIDNDDLAASDWLLERQPDASLYGIRIGYPAAYRMGAARDRGPA